MSWSPAASALFWLGRSYVRGQIHRHHSAGEAMAPDDRRALRPWFRSATLERARLRHVERIEGPAMLRPLAWLGLHPGLDFRSAAGITFGNLVLIADHHRRPQRTAWRRLLFHELVHVVQYELLGVDRFVDHYVRGFVDHGFDYYRIPLEVQAYALEARFAEHLAGAERFSVEDEVAAALGSVVDPG